MLVWLQLFTLLLLVALGFYVFAAAPRQRAHQTFAAFIFFLALWTVKDIVLWNFHEANQAADWWASASFIFALLMQFALVVFAWVFPENSRTPKRKAGVLFAPSLILVPAALFGLLWHKIGFENGNFTVNLAPLAFAFVAYVYGVFGYGTFILFKKYKNYKQTQKGQQIAAILWALIITFILKTIANIILPFFEIYDFLPYSATFVLPGVLIYAYAISNFKLFSLENPLTQFRLFPISYKIALSIAAVAIASFILFQIPIAGWSFQNGVSFEAWKRYLVFSVISALIPNLLLVFIVLSIISRPLRRVTTAAVQVTNGAYGTEIEIRRTNDEISLLAESFNEMSRKMASDIEELRNLNVQLINTEKLAAMGTLSAGVAHEVNNPLASISSLIQMMQNQPNLDEATKEKLRLISTQIQRISRVTKEMMEFARTRPAAKIQADINEVLDSTLRLASFDAAFKKIEIKKNYDPKLPNLLVDRGQMQQVFLNLFLNSRDAMPQGGTLSISTEKKENQIIIQIADTGSGIEEEIIGKVFDPFFSTKPAGQGTGLGLAVCYGIITAHNGEIVVSRSSNRETIFNISLPISESF